MPRYERNNQIVVLGKEFNVEELIVNLSKVPSTEIVDFFSKLNLNFEREIRIKVLRELFLDYALETRRERASLADEMNYRLSWFNQFSESQLVNLFNFYKDDELIPLFLENLWLSLLEVITDKKITDDDLMNLINLANNYSDLNSLGEDILLYNNNLDALFYDHKGYIDGLTPEQLRPVLYKSSTMTEIRTIGKKYGVNVPQRLKKAELLDIILEELKDNGKYTLELEEKLKKMNVILIQRFAFDNDIKASTELKKEEIIEYILKNAEITKESYYTPSEAVYEVEARDVGESIEDLEEVLEPALEEVEEVEDELEDEQVEEVVEEVLEPSEELVEEVGEELDEELVEEILDDIIKEELKEEKIVYVTNEVKTTTKVFDPETVRKTVLNINSYYGNKNKNFKKSLKEEELFLTEVEEENLKKEDQIFETSLKRVSGVRKFFKFIFGLLITIIVLALILAIYAIVTEFTGNINALTNIEAKIAGWIKIDLFQVVRDFARKLYNSILAL